MWIQTPGAVNDRLTFLGTRKSCVYLLKGEHHALIGGAGQWVVPEIERQFREWDVDTDRIRYLVVGHVHFDHCGAVPYLLKKYPHLEVVASPGAKAFLGIPKAVRNIRNFSREATVRMGFPMEYGGASLEWDEMRIDHVVGDGDRIGLGDDLDLEFFEAPGHSRCSLVTYVPGARWLFPTDALHVPSEDGGSYLCTASESYRVYRDSLAKFADRRVDLCAWEHHGIRTGEEAHGIVREGIERTRDYQREIRGAIEAGRDPEELASQLGSDWLARAGFPFVTEEILCYIYRAMIATAMEEPLD